MSDDVIACGLPPPPPPPSIKNPAYAYDWDGVADDAKAINVRVANLNY